MARPTGRKLAAVLMADVVGYSRLMGADEPGTVGALRERRAVFSSQIQQHNGRVADAKGDAIMAEFVSAVDAVAAAMAIQQEIERLNRPLPDEHRMSFRIGVNLGDVLEEDGTVYGDGVNVAGRLEALADPGGVCVSGAVQGVVAGKLPFTFEFLGRKSVKNIAQTVPAFRVLRKSVPGPAGHGRRAGATGGAGMPLRWLVAGVGLAAAVAASIYVFLFWAELPGSPIVAIDTSAPFAEPSVAVLPFANLSGDPEQEYFSDGITETLITSLTRLRNLAVIARNSVFAFKGQSADVREIARQLGVRYVVEGSVQKAGDWLRITAQLIDASNGTHLWAESYDRTIKDIFQVQDEIVRRIVIGSGAVLLGGEAFLSGENSARSPRAFDIFLRGLAAQWRISRGDNARARELYEQALEQDPGFAPAYSGLALVHAADFLNGWGASAGESLEAMRLWSRRALEIDPESGEALVILGWYHAFGRGDAEQARAAVERALEAGPGNAFVLNAGGSYLAFNGEAARGAALARRSLRLNPIPPPTFWSNVGWGELLTDNHEDALAAFQNCIAAKPEHLACRRGIICTLAESGRLDEVEAHVVYLEAAMPTFSLQWARLFYPRAMDQATAERLIEALRKAGVREG